MSISSLNSAASSGNAFIDSLRGTTSSAATGASSSATSTTTGSSGSIASAAGQAVSSSSSNNMNENDFLLLFTTQLKNQDPTQPQDNTAFVSQLAQFSQLEATTSMSTSLNNLISTMQGNGLTNAASLIGQSVSAAGIAANLASGGTVSASISLPSGASSVEVDVYDATNTLVHKETLGSQQPGNLAYTWDGTKTDGSSAPAGQYTLSASAVVGGNPATPTVSINDVIKSVSLSPSTQALELTLQGGSTVPLSSISQILN